MHSLTCIAASKALLALMLSVVGLLGGCAVALPTIDREAIASKAVPASVTTTLGRIAKESAPPGDLSGLRLMPLGTFSLDTRIELTRRAEATLDVQYYHLENDETGRWLLRALREAADRGVRVRLLLDDLYTSGQDSFLLGFSAHKNIEVRLFNPFCLARESGQTTRFAASILDIGRLNHRMHNKLLVADGAMAVVGGRNVANEYYLRGMSGNFIDMDAFVVGSAVPALQNQFDLYWNSLAVFPLTSIARSKLTREQQIELFSEAISDAKTPAPAALASNDVLGYGPIADDLDIGRLGLNWGAVDVFADSPNKVFDGGLGGELMSSSVTYNVLEEIGKAKREVIGSSPYLVPGATGLAFFGAMRDKGVKVTLLTNSLSSTDEPIAHSGYTRYRKPMLELGVELYELGSDRIMNNKRPFYFGSSLGRLHAKLFVIDRETSFIGSMNLDPRSATLNTELGIIVSSPEVSRELIRVIDIDRFQSAYMVRLGKSGGLEWLSMDDEKETIVTVEPETSFWSRLKLWLLTPFVPESFL